MTAWWMWDNHTFTKIDIAEPDWRDAVMVLWDQEPHGHFFVRLDGRQVCAVYNYKSRDEFLASLYAFEPSSDYQI